MSLPLNDPKAESFARHCAAGKTKREAAVAAGYSKKSASAIGSRLAKRVNVSQRIDELKSQVAEKTVEKAVKAIDLLIKSRESRIADCDDIRRRLRQIIDERAADPTMQSVPGGKTGLVIRQFRAVGTGAQQKIIPEYVIDGALCKEIRACDQQAAEELGQWKDGNPDSAQTPKSAFPEWLTEEWKDRGSINPSEASDDSTQAGRNTRVSLVRSDPAKVLQ